MTLYFINHPDTERFPDIWEGDHIGFPCTETISYALWSDIRNWSYLPDRIWTARVPTTKDSPVLPPEAPDCKVDVKAFLCNFTAIVTIHIYLAEDVIINGDLTMTPYSDLPWLIRIRYRLMKALGWLLRKPKVAPAKRVITFTGPTIPIISEDNLK